jgi:hypothetical protein
MSVPPEIGAATSVPPPAPFALLYIDYRLTIFRPIIGSACYQSETPPAAAGSASEGTEVPTTTSYGPPATLPPPLDRRESAPPVEYSARQRTQRELYLPDRSKGAPDLADFCSFSDCGGNSCSTFARRASSLARFSANSGGSFSASFVCGIWSNKSW